jgi:hypothetical protein
LLARLADGARRRAASFAWERQGRQMRDVYERVLGEGFDWSDRRAYNVPAVQRVSDEALAESIV